ncbi:hypothetical protein Hanom_Chr05g00446981 [Helianthus anomalus]
MAYVVRPPSTMTSMVLSKVQSTDHKFWKPANYRFTFPRLATKHRTICCTNVTPWNPPSVTCALKMIPPKPREWFRLFGYRFLVFLGPNIASLLSLTGLDCIFNLGASLFLLIADACSRPNTVGQDPCLSQPPMAYKFWNMVATVSGFIIPLVMLFGSEKGLFQPQLPPISFAILLGPYLPPISFAILLGPYLLLLVVQMLTWHWESPVFSVNVQFSGT